MNGPLTCREVAHGSDEYLSGVELRRRVLRIPLGLDFSVEEVEEEHIYRHLVAADGDGKVVGCLILTEPDEVKRFTKMRQVAVEPDLQGKGIGGELVRFSESVARAAGARGMFLHAREAALKFYERLGYHVEGDAFIEVGIRHWRMGKVWILA